MNRKWSATWKRIVAVFIIFVMSISNLSYLGCYKAQADAAANSNVKYSGKSQDLEWSIDNDGKLTITGSGDYDKDLRYSNGWLRHRSDIITAEVNVTDITKCDYMFYDCWNLQSVVFKKLQGKGDVDCADMFGRCSKLTSIDFSGVQSLSCSRTQDMFENCYLLESVDLSKLNTSKCTYFSYMFSRCEAMKSIDLTKLSFASVPSDWKATSILAGSCFDEVKVPANYAFSEPLPSKSSEPWLEWYAKGENVGVTNVIPNLDHVETYAKRHTDNNGIYSQAACTEKATESDLTIS